MAIPLVPLRRPRTPSPPPSPLSSPKLATRAGGYERVPSSSGDHSSSHPPPPNPQPRRLTPYLTALGVLLFLFLATHYSLTSSSSDPFAAEDRQGRCEFVSPLEAYYRRAGNSFEAGPPEGLKWNENGELEWEMDQVAVERGDREHPIKRLLERGERHWQALVGREPTTLVEAVREYEQRWGRRPPKGFDRWFAFTQKHNVLLSSTYQPLLQSSLQPFHALPPQELVRRAKLVEGFRESFVLDVQGGEKGNVNVELKDGWKEKWGGTELRAQDQADLMKPFLKDLPSMRVAFSLHDGPSIYPHHERTAALRSLAERGLHDEDAANEEDVHDVDWTKVCGRTLNKEHAAIEPRSFIYDHEKAQDVCLNPTLLGLNGIYLEEHTVATHPRPHSMHLPMLSFSKTPANGDILAAPLDMFNDKVGSDPEWAKKSNDQLVWRGSTTGIEHSPAVSWRSSHRARLVQLTNPVTPAQPISPPPPRLPHVVLAPVVGKHSGKLTLKKLGLGNKAFEMWKEWAFDIAYTGRGIQCEGDEGDLKTGKGSTGTCKQLMDEYHFTQRQKPEEMNKHKFLLDVDGNAWSGRFRRLLATNSLLLKSTTYPEWYSSSLIPWFHYIPVKSTYSDLLDILSFFRGPPHDPLNPFTSAHSALSPGEEHPGFDEVAQAIARNGQCFVRRMWRKEDLQAYMFLVYLEMARLLSGDRTRMDLPPLD